MSDKKKEPEPTTFEKLLKRVADLEKEVKGLKEEASKCNHKGYGTTGRFPTYYCVNCGEEV